MASPIKSRRTESTGKVNFFNHFPKDFIQPYGIATNPAVNGTKGDIPQKLKPFTCEWLCRSGIAISELNETMETNWQRIEDDLSLLSDPIALRNGKRYLQDLIRLSDIKSFPDDGRAHRSVADLMNKLSQDNEDANAFIDTAYHIGASLYSLAITVKVAQWIYDNLDKVASESFAGNNMSTFRENPTKKNFCKCIVKDISASRSSSAVDVISPRKTLRQIIQERASTSEAIASRVQPPSSRSKEPAKKRKSVQPST